MSREQPQYQHPLDKRLQAVNDEYQRFSSTEPQDKIFKEILELRATLLRSYDEDDYEINLKELETKTKQLYDEIDAGQSWFASLLNSINPDPVQLARQSKIDTLRAAIEDDKKTVRNYLDLPAEMRLAYLIGVAERVSREDPNNLDDLMELNSIIETLYESIPEKARNVRSSSHEATPEEIYQEFHQKIEVLRESSNVVEVKSEASEVSEMYTDPMQERVDEFQAEAKKIQADYKNTVVVLIGLLEKQVIVQNDLNQLDSLESQIVENEENLNKLEQAYEELLESYDFEYQSDDGKRELKSIFANDIAALNIARKDASEILQRYSLTSNDDQPMQELGDEEENLLNILGKMIHNPLFNNDEARGIEEEERRIEEEMRRIEEEDHKLEVEERKLEAEARRLENEIHQLKEEGHIHSKSLPPTPAKPFRTKEQSHSIDEGVGKPLPPAPEKTSKFMKQIKAAPIPQAPNEVKPVRRTSVPVEQQLVEGENVIIAEQKKQADKILNNFISMKSDLLSNTPEKLSTEEALRIQQAVTSLLQFVHDNRDNKNVGAEVKDMRAEVADIQAKLKQYLKTSATFERTITRAPSAIVKVYSGKLSSRHIIENTKNEIKAATDEVPRFYHMGKKH